MTENELTILCAVLSSSLLTGLVSKIADAIIDRHKKKNIANDVHAKSERLTLLYVLKASGNEYIERGKICETDFRAFDETYHTYKDLGGDGYADKIYKAVTELEVET